MTDRVSRLGSTRRLTVAEYLVAIAQHLRANHAGKVEDLLAAAADTCWPSSTMGGGPSGTAEPATPVERAAFNRDTFAAQARWTLAWLGALERDAARAHAILSACNPDRTRAYCPYGHPIANELSRCTWRDPETSLTCGTRANTARWCEDCREPETNVPGSKVTTYTTPWGDAVLVCAKDRRFRERNGGRPRASVARLLADAADLLAADGTYTEAEAG